MAKTTGAGAGFGFKSPTHEFTTTRKSDGVVIYRAKLTKKRCAHGSCRILVSLGGPYCAKHRASVAGLRVAPSRMLAAIGVVNGNGVFTTKDRRAGEIIAFYDCERVTDQQLDEIYGDNGTRVYSLTDDQSLWDNTYADAHRSRCVASLINDSRGSRRLYDNNVYFCNLSQPYAIRASRDIAAGEELLLSYGRDYWNGFKTSPYVYATTLC
jgi:hypothetical protein